MRYFILPVFITGIFTVAKAQVTEKHNLVYNNAKFDVFVAKIDSSVTNRFTIIANTSNLSEAAYFDSLSRSLQSPFLAITASIVDSVCNPLGLYIMNGNKIGDINNNQGNGNFFLKPNGFISLDTAGNVEIQDAMNFQAGAYYKYAIQSGPMLIINGAINSVFDKNSKNRNIRCGVGTYNENGDKFIVFVRANEPVSFYHLAQVFKEKFNCNNALTLESGGNSSLHLPTYKLNYNNKLFICRFIIISL